MENAMGNGEGGVSDQFDVVASPDGFQSAVGSGGADSLDTILRSMSEDDPFGWAKTIADLVGLAEPASAVLATTDLTAMSVRADRVLLVDDGDVVVHIEFQRSFDPDFALRMLDYYVRLRRLHRRPIVQVVVVTKPGATMPSHVELDGHRVGFAVLRPEECSVDFFMKSLPAMAVLAAHTVPDEEFLADTLKRIVDAEGTAQNESGTSNVGYAIALARHRFAPSVIESIARMDDMSIAEIIADTPPGRELLERGLEQGLEQGLQKGRGEGMAALLEVQLEHRFGQLSSSDLARLRSLRPDELTALAIDGTDFSSLGDLRDWLAARETAG